MRSFCRLTLLATLVISLVPVEAAARATTFDRCLSRIANDVVHFLKKRAQCTRACEDDVRSGRLGTDTDCGPGSLHGPTQRCHAKASERLAGSRATTRRVCQNDELAAFYFSSTTCPGENQSLPELLECLRGRTEGFLDELLRDVYHPAPAEFCGDGRIGPSEQCDPTATPNGCPFAWGCGSDCRCIFPGCGNGVIDIGEDCDYAVFPNGCRFDEFCDGSCSCFSFGSAAEAFLCEVPDLLR